MPKPKQFVKENKKKSKHAAQTPQTADEYLAAGVDFEEAGEKWRAGDAAKSSRFFLRALATYDEGLTKFPTSFDLAYNKARVQYEITQYPRLAAQMTGTVVEMLEMALESSRVALGLRQDNADVLFNTAQVLTSLVEALTEDRSRNVPMEDSLRLLEEAIELFQRCITLQEYQHAEAQAQKETEAFISAHKAQSALQSSDSEAPSSSTATTSAPEHPTPSDHSQDQAQEEEEWATIIEPVTNDALLDTVLAQLETLTLLCTLLSSSSSSPSNPNPLAWIEEYATTLLSIKLPAYIQGTSRATEAALTRANFLSALADANFCDARLDAATYAQTLDDAFANLDLTQHAEGLVDKAEALATFAHSLGTVTSTFKETTETANDPSQTATATAAMRWKAYTSALESLTLASKITTPSDRHNVATLHGLRGDVELKRYRLGQEGNAYEVARKNAGTLLKNAATYYRGAEACARADGDEEGVREGVVKQALVAALGGDEGRLQELVKSEAEMTRRMLEDAVEEGLVEGEWLVGEGFVGGGGGGASGGE